MNRKETYPTKTTMNLYYKPDRTTMPSTVALYALFGLVVLLALAKYLVYDVWQENQAAQRALRAAQNELNGVLAQLTDYDEVQERYFRYAATDEERALVDRMDVLNMLDSTVRNAKIDSISINGSRLQIQISNVTLAQTSEIVNRLEASPLVSSVTVNTAATTEKDSDLTRSNIVIQLQKEVEE